MPEIPGRAAEEPRLCLMRAGKIPIAGVRRGLIKKEELVTSKKWEDEICGIKKSVIFVVIAWSVVRMWIMTRKKLFNR